MTKIFKDNQEVLQAQAKGQSLPEKKGLPEGLVEAIVMQKSREPEPEGTVIYDPASPPDIKPKEHSSYLDAKSVSVPVSSMDEVMKAKLGHEGYIRWVAGKQHDAALTEKIRILNSKPRWQKPIVPKVEPAKPSHMQEVKLFLRMAKLMAKVLWGAFKDLFRR